MKVLQIHVGNEVIPDLSFPEGYYLQRLSFHDGQLKYYTKWDIVTADTQMNSIRKQGVNLIYGHLSDRKSISALLRAGKRLSQLCADEKVDIVHVYWGSTTALMTVLFSRRPVVISFSGSDLLGNVNAEGKINLSGRVSRFLSQLAGVFAARIITKSQHMKHSLWALNRRNAVAIPNGLDLSKFTPLLQDECRNRLRWDKRKKYILFFDGGGAIVKDKPLAEKVFGLVQEQIPNTVLFIARGIVHDELVYYYNAADALLITSFHEGSNNSLKEARACNLPVVSVDVGDAKERLEQVQNSYVVDSRDPSLIAQSLIKVLSAGVRSNGADFSGDVDIEHIARQVVKVYEQISTRN